MAVMAPPVVGSQPHPQTSAEVQHVWQHDPSFGEPIIPGAIGFLFAIIVIFVLLSLDGRWW